MQSSQSDTEVMATAAPTTTTMMVEVPTTVEVAARGTFMRTATMM
ncbi:hypothetical protein [Sporosarcina koreensis]|uniref:Uncharacterized protein n=1 Tax=Sporosarcina koreensis TaxID=334735 RepID=A0ABW0TZ91_9BACL